MIIEILDYIGTFFILFGAFLITSKKAFNPKIRRIAIVSYLISCSLWIPMAILLGTLGLFVSQIVLVLINVKGLINIKRELKNEKQ